MRVRTPDPQGVSMRSSVISAQGAEVPLHNSSVTPTAQQA